MNFIPEIKLDLTPLAQSLADIFSSTHKGVCKLLNLCLGNALAGVVRQRVLQDAQNRCDARSINVGTKRYENGVLMDVIDHSGDGDVVGLLSGKIQKDELTNFVKALENTVKMLETIPEKTISDEPVQKKFFNRWRKEVELIDDEQLRSFWSRILAQEIVSPSKISLRTLDVVRNLAATEARLFQRMVKGEIDGMIPIDNKGYPQYVDYSDALALQDAGLIFAQQSRRTFRLGYDAEQKGVAIPLKKSRIVACVHDVKEYSTQCYILTDAGRCLLPIAQENRDLQDYIAIFNRMMGKDSKTIVSLHAMIQSTEDETRWNTIPLWTRTVKENSTAEKAKVK